MKGSLIGRRGEVMIAPVPVPIEGLEDLAPAPRAPEGVVPIGLERVKAGAVGDEREGAASGAASKSAASRLMALTSGAGGHAWAMPSGKAAGIGYSNRWTVLAARLMGQDKHAT